jgi:putative flippase GtrA
MRVISRMLQTLADTRRFFQTNDWRTILARMNARDTHPVIQFMKYGICGVGSLIVGQSIWLALSTKGPWPALDGSLPDTVRAMNSTWNNIIAFFFGNLFAYITNSKWVFTPGRHSRLMEFTYFTLISTVAFVIGLMVGPLLIKLYGIHTLLAQLLMISASVMVNYVCRKFFVFKG